MDVSCFGRRCTCGEREEGEKTERRTDLRDAVDARLTEQRQVPLVLLRLLLGRVAGPRLWEFR